MRDTDTHGAECTCGTCRTKLTKEQYGIAEREVLKLWPKTEHAESPGKETKAAMLTAVNDALSRVGGGCTHQLT